VARKLDFQWNLRQLMAAHDIWKTPELIPLLAERGVPLSTAQVYRLVTDKPERLSMKTLVALCDILDCTPSDLIEPFVAAAQRPKTAGASVTELNPDFRPARARITDDPPGPSR
jgi:DNA-binding Xre family transcriptional regulator